MFAPVAFHIFSSYFTEITDIGSLVIHRIGIQNFFIATGDIHTNAVLVARDRREVTDYDNAFAIGASALKSEDRIRGIVHHKPIKAFRRIIKFEKRTILLLNTVQVFHQFQHAFVPTTTDVFVQQKPIQTFFVIPFAPLCKFIAHKQ